MILLSRAVIVLLTFGSTFAWAGEISSIPQLQKDLLLEDFDEAGLVIPDLQGLASLTAFGIRNLGGVYQFPHPDGAQVVMPSNPTEKKLIEKSNIDTEPVEFGVFIAHMKSGDTIGGGESDFFGSNEGAVISSQTLSQKISEFINNLISSGKIDDVKYIEVIHTHPRYDAYDSDHAVLVAINEQDLFSAHVISSNLGNFPVMMTAVVPNGYSYKAMLLGRENITFQVFQ